MTATALAAAAFLLLAVGFLVTSRRAVLSGFRLLQSNFETLQRVLLAQQQQFERSLDSRTGRLEERLTASLKDGLDHFEKVQEGLRQTERQLLQVAAVGQSVQELNNLLKLPHLRGGFGEATLERILADSLPAGAYELQYRIDPESTERVDAVVKYPKQLLPIDSKFPREQVLALFESSDPREIEIARERLADVMKAQARAIREKYVRPDLGTSDMALVFLPSETLYFECVRSQRLTHELTRLRVFPVSPNTLTIALQAVRMAREYYEAARGIEETLDTLRKARRHLESFEGRFDDVGKALARAQESFQTAGHHYARFTGSLGRLPGSSET